MGQRRQVDFEAVKCLDIQGHNWHEQPARTSTGHVYKGSPVRVFYCLECDSIKAMTLAWDGKVLTTARESGPVYINEARKLGAMNDRRRIVREHYLKLRTKEAKIKP